MNHYLRPSPVANRPEAVDRQNAVIRGYVLAQAGVFKDRRGQFDAESLREIVRLGNATPNGLKSRLGHPTMSDDGIGKHLGRARGLRLGTTTDARTGKAVAAVRGDLHFDKTALAPPPGGGGTPYGQYVMDLAESDPGAFSSSLVLQVKEEDQLDAKGNVALDDDGEPLPSLWRPTALHASDVVDTGDAVDSFLSPEQLTAALTHGLTPEALGLVRFDRVARLAQQLLDHQFRNASEADIRAHALAWLDRYLGERFPAEELPAAVTPRLDRARARLPRLESHSR